MGECKFKYVCDFTWLLDRKVNLDMKYKCTSSWQRSSTNSCVLQQIVAQLTKLWLQDKIAPESPTPISKTGLKITWGSDTLIFMETSLNYGALVTRA